MSKWCSLCGREKGPPEHGMGGVCNLAQLSDGRTVHASRIDLGGDLHEKLGKKLKVVNRWQKTG